MERINILWTGGYDSTFRLCQLSLLPVEVQPYYIKVGRKSEAQEMKAMASIVQFIQRNEARKFKLLPVQLEKLENVPPDKEISEAHKRLSSEHPVGSQYEWFARFARHTGLTLEMGYENNTASNTNNFYGQSDFLKEFSMPLAEGEESLAICKYDKARCPEDLFTLFGSFHFGLPLKKMTKLQTLEKYKEIGYEAVVPLTWFCAHPLLGKPCGLCNPCATVMKTGMGFRMPPGSRILYFVFKANRAGRYIDKKLKAIYNRYWRK